MEEGGKEVKAMANLFLLALILVGAAWIISFFTRDKEPKHKYQVDITVQLNGANNLKSQLKVRLPCSELTIKPFERVRDIMELLKETKALEEKLVRLTKLEKRTPKKERETA